MIKRTLTVLTAMALLFTGCTMEIIPQLPEREESGETGDLSGEGTVKFNIRQEASTRSSIDIDENQLSEVDIYAYCDGLLYSHIHSTTPETVSIKLKKGTVYNLYAVANAPQQEPVQQEAEFLENFHIRLNSINDLNRRNMLSWSYQGYVLSSPAADISMEMVRLYSKVNFRLDKGALRGLEVKSVRLCQAPGAIYPFQGGGNRASSPETVIDGDYASAADLTVLNTTENGITLYTPENMQGRLLPTNRDPWAKTPENIPGKEKLCTYLEVNASFKEGFLYSGNVTYRFYLGRDNITDFNIPRNTDMGIILSISGDNFGEGLQEISWKVLSDTSINPLGYASMQKVSAATYGTFAGDRAEYEVILSDELYNHLDNDVTNCYVAATDFTGHAPGDIVKEQIGKDHVTFTPLKLVSSVPNRHVFRTVASFMRCNSYSFALYDRRTGTFIAQLDCIENTVSAPVIGFSTEKNNVSADAQGHGNILFSELPLSINEEPLVLYVHALQKTAGGNSSYSGRNRAGVISGTTRGETMSMDRSFFKDLDWSFTWKAGTEYRNLVTYRWEPAPADSPDEYIGTLTVMSVNNGRTDPADVRNYINLTRSEPYSPVNIGLKPATAEAYRGRLSLIPNSILLGYRLTVEYIPDQSEKPRDNNSWAFNMSIVVHNQAKLPFTMRSLLQIPAINDTYGTRPKGLGPYIENKVGSFMAYSANSAYPINRRGTNEVTVADPYIHEARYTDYIEFNTRDRNTSGGRWINDSTIFHRYIYANGSSNRSGISPADIDHEFQINTEILLDGTYRPRAPLTPAIGTTARLHSADVCQIEYDNRYTEFRKPDEGPKVASVGSRNWAVNMCIDDYLNVKKACKEYAFKRNPEDEEWGTNPYLWKFDWTSSGFQWKKSSQREYDIEVKMHGEMFCERKEGRNGSGSWIPFNPGTAGIIDMKSYIYYIDDKNTIDKRWEDEMYRFKTPAYRFEYWHSISHNKKTHHVTHPMPVRIDQFYMLLKPKVLQLEQGHNGTIVPFIYVDTNTPGANTIQYKYQRTHIDKDSEKNDDSRYNYTVTMEWFQGEYYKYIPTGQYIYSLYELP